MPVRRAALAARSDLEDARFMRVPKAGAQDLNASITIVFRRHCDNGWTARAKAARTRLAAAVPRMVAAGFRRVSACDSLGDQMISKRTHLSAALLAGLVLCAPAGLKAQQRPAPVEVTQVFVQGIGQVNVLAYKAKFVSADPVTRRVVLEDPAGRRWAVIAPPLLGDLSLYRVGENLLIRVAPGVVTALGKAHQGRPGEVMAEVAINDGLPGWPEGFGIREVKLTSIFVGLDPAAGTVTFEGPDGNVRVVRAANDKVLADVQNVRPGDLAQITYIEGLAVNAMR